MFHPNICPSEGKVCMNILEPREWYVVTCLLVLLPRNVFYMSRFSRGAATRLKEVLEAARFLLNLPNPLSPLNGSAAAMLRWNTKMYEQTNQVWTHVFAGGKQY